MRCNNMFLQTTCVLNTGYPYNMWHNRPESIREWNPKRSITHTSTQLSLSGSLVASVIETLQSLVQHLSVWMFLVFSLQIFLQLIGFICSSFVSKRVLQLPLMIFMFSRRLFPVYVFPFQCDSSCFADAFLYFDCLCLCVIWTYSNPPQAHGD